MKSRTVPMTVWLATLMALLAGACGPAIDVVAGGGGAGETALGPLSFFSGTVAIVTGTVVSDNATVQVAYTDLDGEESDWGEREVIDVAITGVVWNLGDACRRQEITGAICDDPGEPIDLIRPLRIRQLAPDTVFTRGTEYVLYLSHFASASVPWRAHFAIEADTEAMVPGHGTDRTAAAIDRMRLPGESRADALLAFTLEQVPTAYAWWSDIDVETLYGPRTWAALDRDPIDHQADLGPFETSLEEFLADDANGRWLGMLREDLPAGAGAALGVEFTFFEALVLYDPTVLEQATEVAVLFPGVGFLGWAGLDPQANSTHILGNAPIGAPLQLLARASHDDDEPPRVVPLTPRSTTTELTVIELDTVLDRLARGHGLVIDLRGGADTFWTLDRDAFDRLIENNAGT